MQAGTQKFTLKEKFIGDRPFYKMVLALMVPIVIQNGISNFVSLLDNIMVGRLGTEPMSGVSIVNTILFIYFLAIFGGLGGVGIFTAQYYGNGDTEGIRHTFRYKIWLGLIITVIAFAILKLFGPQLIGLYLTDSGDGGDLALTLKSGMDYLNVCLWYFPAFLVLQFYASTIRECGETVLPMKAGVIAVIVNLIFNYLLIYGKFGFPEMGVRGAALATVLSRYVECLIVVIWTHTHKEKNRFVEGLYRTLLVPWRLVKKYFKDGILLLINETCWSMGMAFLTQCYSTRGLVAVASLNISGTITNMFNIFFFAMGDAIAIIVGQKLGAGKLKEAKDCDNKLIAFGVLIAIGTAVLIALLAPLFPRLYNTTDDVRKLANALLYAHACFTPFMAFTHCAYFTLRSGGKTFITLLFDSVATCFLYVPLAFVLSRFTALPLVTIYCLVNGLEILKCVLGYILVKKNIWIQNIVTD